MRTTIAACVLLLTPTLGHAIDAELDRTFGSMGWTQINPSSHRDGGENVALQPDGKILLAGWRDSSAGGNWVVARFTAAGALDPTFAGGGVVPVPAMHLETYTGDVAVQPDGKIVVCGGGDFPDPEVLIARYESDGSPDPTFGLGGVAAVDVSSGVSVVEHVETIAIQPDGRIIVAGYHYDNFAPQPLFEPFVVRVLSDGTPDPSFGVAGIVALAVPVYGIPFDVALQPDGKIVLGGYAVSAAGSFMVIRLEPDGTYDAGFGSNGVVVTPGDFGTAAGRAVHLKQDGRILLGGWSGNFGAVVRYLPNGSPDAAFGIDGVALVADPDGNDIFGNDMVVRSDDSIVLVGEVQRTGNPDGTDVAVARFDADGVPDAGFAPGGFVRIVIGSETSLASGAVIRPDDKIVVTGQRNAIGSLTPGTHDTRILLARIGHTCGDGVVDPGDQCDDANTTLGDCCTPNCTVDPAGSPCGPGDTDACLFDACDGAGTCVIAQPEPSGTPCGADDGDPCTYEGCDGAGACAPGHPEPAGTPCDGPSAAPCLVDTCDGAGACTGAPTLPTACLAPTLPLKSALTLVDKEGTDRDSLNWKWTKGPAVSDFGSPATTTGLALCLYDGSTVLFETPIPPGVEWIGTSKGWSLKRDANTTPGGIGRAKLRFGTAGRSRITVKGRGPLLGLVDLPLPSPVRMALVSSEGTCFHATYSAPRVNTDLRYRAKGQ